MVPAIVSSLMPKNVRQVVGPSHFAVERGTPNSRQVVVTAFRESAHCEESGAPTMTKSSR